VKGECADDMIDCPMIAAGIAGIRYKEACKEQQKQQYPDKYAASIDKEQVYGAHTKG